ncbi:PAS domain-containing protein [Thalassotalea euphylliae]|uniref:Sensory/regulatory protein RpfC n=1 Tax=Thalassotalea euphylliae TaxID=1655234 RepID=A0A3E0UCC8_9GAMM|nr:PAS domain-containing protein [Thalassotalea euphylliae]REL34384.1 response regulator [Thalassotalea euphylliae]
MQKMHSVLANFTRRYVLLFALNVVLVIAAFYQLRVHYQEQQIFQQVSITANEQRNLLQQITLLLQSYQQGNGTARDAKLATKVISTATRMRDNLSVLVQHVGLLMENKSSDFSRNYQAYYDLSQRLASYLDSAKALGLNSTISAEQQAQINELASDDFVFLFEHALDVFQLEASQRYHASERKGYVIWSITILVFLFVAYYAYYVMRKLLRDTYSKLSNERNRASDFQFAINKHSLVLQFDQQGTITFYNKRFSKVYGYQPDALLFQPVEKLRSDHHSDSFIEKIYQTLRTGNVWRGELCTLSSYGRKLWFTTTIVPLKADTKRNKFILIQNDITEQRRTEFALKRIHEITTNSNADLDDKMQQILALGCDLFHLPNGIISQIEDDDYVILSALSPDDALQPGDTFTLAKTYCFHTLNANKPLAIEHVANSELSGHPCYQEFALETYIGTPLWVDGKRYGTMNFSSDSPSAHTFKDSDIELLQLMAHWVGYELTRNRQREQLSGQQQLMEHMSQLARLGAWEVDLKTNQIYWSSMTKQIHEVPADYVPELATAINFYKEGRSRDLITQLVERSIAYGESYEQELELVTATGREIWVIAKGEAEFEDGECVRLYGSFQDITERVKAQQALSDSNERLASVIHATAVGIWDWEIDTDKAVLNERWANIIGYTLEELAPVSAKSWSLRVHPDDLPKSQLELERHWRGETERYNCETRLRHKDGHWLWVLDTGKVVEWHEDGRPKRMIGTHLDISEQKAAAREITESNQRMSLAADSAGIGVWDFNVLTNELQWDEWMLKLYGLERDSFSGALSAWRQGLHPDDRKQISAQLQEAISTANKFDAQFRIIRPSGEVRYIKASAINTLNETGQVTNLIGVNYDVTDRVRDELALKAAKTQAESAVKAKNEFLASMSHEIRTPMNGVIGMLELLQDSELDRDQQHKVQLAQSSANSLLQLINDILDFSKIDADKLDLEAIVFDLAHMMGELSEAMAPQAQRKGIELILDTVGLSDRQVIGDPSRIRQVLTNLISNAIKFTHSGEVVISASLTEEDEAYWRLKLVVKDTGIGIPQDKLHLLFEKFRQVDSSTTRHYGGTGLGLAIVKKLCQRMNGNVSVSTVQDKGSEFTCDIRVGKTPQIVASMPEVDISELTILLVDDNDTNREVLNRQLTQWGANVTSCSSGEQALLVCQQRIETEQPLFDIGILDMQMPTMDGEMLARELIKLDPEQQMKLIVMTSMQTPGDAKHFAQMGFSGYFPKPATINDLRAAVNIIADDGEALRFANPLVTRHYISELGSQSEQGNQSEPNSQDSANDQPSNLAQPAENNNNPISTVDTERVTPIGTSSQPAENPATPHKILLVEDNRVNQMVAKGVLNKLGYSCDIAANGIEAIAMLSASNAHYDVALMDIQMPKMDGYQATRAIRAGDSGKRHQEMVIIAMTANAMAGDREKCLAAGMNDYLSKPINKDALSETLNRYLATVS